MNETSSTIPLVTFDCEQDPTPLPPEGLLSTRARMGWQPPDWLLDAIQKDEEERRTRPPLAGPTDAPPPS